MTWKFFSVLKLLLQSIYKNLNGTYYIKCLHCGSTYRGWLWYHSTLITYNHFGNWYALRSHLNTYYYDMSHLRAFIIYYKRRSYCCCQQWQRRWSLLLLSGFYHHRGCRIVVVTAVHSRYVVGFDVQNPYDRPGAVDCKGNYFDQRRMSPPAPEPPS